MNAAQRRRRARKVYVIAGGHVQTGSDFRYPVTAAARDSAVRELAMLDEMAPRTYSRAGVAVVVALLNKAAP